MFFTGIRKFFAEHKFFSGKRFKILLVMSLFAAFLSLIINFSFYSPFSRKYKVGDFAQGNVKAPRTIEVENEEATDKARNEAENSTPNVFDFESNTQERTKRKIRLAFSSLRRNPEVENGQKVFEEQLGKVISAETFATFKKAGFSWRLERGLEFCINALPAGKYFIDDKDVIFKDGLGEILVNELNSAIEKNEYKRVPVFQQFQLFMTIEEATRTLLDAFDKISKKFMPEEQKALSDVLLKILEPNLTFNRQKTEDLKKLVRERTKKVIIRANKGEIIVRDGEPVEKQHLIIINAIRKLNKEFRGVVSYFFHFLIYLMVFSVLVSFDIVVFPSVTKLKDIWALGFFAVFYALVLKIWVLFSSLLSSQFSFIPTELFLLLFPFAALALVVRILFSPEISALMTLIGALIMGLMTEGNFLLAVYVLFSSYIAIVFITRFDERSVILRAGLYLGLFQAVFAAVLALARINLLEFSWWHILYAAAAGLLSGLFSAFAAEAIIPLMEYAFGYTTNIKLLEYGNTNHPLLRQLLIKAPGTYHHSMIVGQLASAAAEEINANTLLARIGSYYHDVGKMNKAVYFIENLQPNMMNPHDKLNPTMSARILVSHVKDGVKLAAEHKIGLPVIDIIEQHHGTSLMKYFYGKALEQGAEPDMNDYRYTGPKPQTREAVLVMLADSCEAACRSLEEPTPAKIQSTVERIINNTFADGQFDECNITLRRLKTISQTYTKILISLNHARIDYPELQIGDAGNGNTNEKRKGAVQPDAPQKVADRDLHKGTADSGL